MKLLQRSPTSVRCFVLFVVVLAIIGSSCNIILDPYRNAPTDAELRSAFAEKRADFETLVKMSNDDEKVIRITNDFTWVSRLGSSTDTGDLGFSSERWSEYKLIFSKLNLHGGIARGHDGSVWFLCYTSGLGVSGLTKGLVFAPTPLNCDAGSLDRIEQIAKRECVQLEKKWYLYLAP